MKRAMQHPLAIATLSLGLAVPLGVLAQTPEALEPAAGAIQRDPVKGPVGTVEVTAIEGQVTAIDRAKRRVAVRADDGRAVTMHVGPNVRNFEQLAIGDQVSIRYSEAVSLAIAKGGSGSDLGAIRTKVEADAARQAAPGAKPGMAAVERTTLVANVFDIDRERNILTLRGTDGVPVDIKVEDEAALRQIELNDQVVIGYRQAAAVSIEPRV